jgi:hypothetical protein
MTTPEIETLLAACQRTEGHPDACEHWPVRSACGLCAIEDRRAAIQTCLDVGDRWALIWGLE